MKSSSKRKHMRRHSRRHTRKQQRGAGYSDVLPMIYPGGLTHQQYTGPGKDCPGVPVRPGYIENYSYVNKGLPGFSGGRRRKHRRTHRRRGGASQLGSGGPVLVNGALVQPFKGSFTTGATNELKQMDPAPVMRGGRYGFFPDLGPLNQSNGVGVAPAPFMRVPCEAGTVDPLNKDIPLQMATTEVIGNNVRGWTPLVSEKVATSGGGRRRKGKKSRKMRGGVYVGQVDSMRYEAQNAGYENLPLRPPVQNNPGILMQVGYPAGHFNSACMNTK